MWLDEKTFEFHLNFVSIITDFKLKGADFLYFSKNLSIRYGQSRDSSQKIFVFFPLFLSGHLPYFVAFKITNYNSTARYHFFL
jgi:hypothetical protein